MDKHLLTTQKIEDFLYSGEDPPTAEDLAKLRKIMDLDESMEAHAMSPRNKAYADLDKKRKDLIKSLLTPHFHNNQLFERYKKLKTSRQQLEEVFKYGNMENLLLQPKYPQHTRSVEFNKLLK